MSRLKLYGLIAVAIVAVLAIVRVVHAEQIQTCKALAPVGYTGQTLAGCPLANVTAGPALTTDLVRTIVANKQLWAAFSSLIPDSPVVPVSTGKWATLSSITLTPAPTTPTAPPVVTPPVVDYTTITSYTLERSADGGKTWDAVSVTISYPPQASAQCFRITPYRADGTGPAIVSCPVPK